MVWAGVLLSVAWPTGVQLLVFFCSSIPVVLLEPQGSPGVDCNTFLSSPYLYFGSAIMLVTYFVNFM